MRTSVVAAVFALVVTACPAAQTCDFSTCSGCCGSDGICYPGNVDTSCGAMGFLCVSCPGGQTCNSGTCAPVPTCVPQTCASAGATCGELPDGCGGVLTCGACGAGESCGGGGTANACGPGTCSPKTCAGLAAECGQVSDGCAAVLSCGTCSTGTCGGGGPNRCGTCVPKNCADLQKNCGLVDDGCGGKVSCGTCTVGNQTCGGGGVANVCGTGACMPKTCTELGKDCGAVPDGCGNTLQCGSCSGFASCGGAGTANVCGAVCTSGCPSGFSCNEMGTCAGGALDMLVLNEVGHAVSGSIQVNGAAPTFVGQWCNQAGRQSLEVAVVTFREAAKGYSTPAPVRCSDNHVFHTLLAPGVYSVRVDLGQYGTSSGINLLDVSYLAVERLRVP